MLCTNLSQTPMKKLKVHLFFKHLFYIFLSLIFLRLYFSTECNFLLEKQPPEAFHKKVILWNFTKFTGKHPRQVSFLIMLQALGLRPATLFKKRLWHSCFPMNFAKFSITSFLKEHLRWLLLLLHPLDSEQGFPFLHVREIVIKTKQTNKWTILTGISPSWRSYIYILPDSSISNTRNNTSHIKGTQMQIWRSPYMF